MSKLGERLRRARVSLHLSEEYVAKQLNIERTAISQIEQGYRQVSNTELETFSWIYGIAADELRLGPSVKAPSQVFARKFSELDEAIQREVFSLMEFKQMMKGRGVQ